MATDTKKYSFRAEIRAGRGGGAYVEFPYDTEKKFGTKGRVPVMVTIDGQIGYELLPGDCVRLRKSPTTLNVITPSDRNYFSVLRGKLRWGGRIERADEDDRC